MNLRQKIRFFAAIAAAAFVLNWIWEMIQMRAYAGMPARPWNEAAAICTIATLGDVVITLTIYFLGALAARRLFWASANSWNVYVFLAVVGFVSAACIERQALAVHAWGYNQKMPVVPYLQVGLWPLLQLTTLVPGAVWIVVQCFPRETTR